MNRFNRSPSAFTWNRDTIMDYLQSIIMTHALIEGLNTQLGILNQKKCALGKPSEPVCPASASVTARWAKNGAILCFLPGLLSACTWQPSPDSAFKSGLEAFITCIIMGVIIGGFLGSIKSDMIKNRINRKYQNQCRVYQQDLSVSLQAQSLLDQHILDITQRLEQARQTLNTLLSADIIYPSYREPWHIYIIWEHMDRRPDLSYLQAEDLSMEDRRVHQITSALEAIRQSIGQLAAYMEPLRLAVYQVSDEVNRMNQSLSGQISDLNRTFQHMNIPAASSDPNAVLQEMNRTLSSIQYNQYQALVNEDLRRYGLLS